MADALGEEMKYYAVGDLEITEGSWVEEYVQNVTKMVERSGGRYLARTANVQKLEGQRAAPKLFLIIEWPSKETAESFYYSEEYRPYREKRVAGAKCEIVLAAGEDVARTAHV